MRRAQNKTKHTNYFRSRTDRVEEMENTWQSRQQLLFISTKTIINVGMDFSTMKIK